MDELITRLLPALRRLHADGAIDDALRLIETIPDLLAGTAGIGTATVLLDVGRVFEGGPIEAPLGCLGSAPALFESEEFAHGIGACDVSAAEIAVATDEPERAVQLYERGLELLDIGLQPVMAGRAWHDFGILLHRRDRRRIAWRLSSKPWRPTATLAWPYRPWTATSASEWHCMIWVSPPTRWSPTPRPVPSTPSSTRSTCWPTSMTDAASPLRPRPLRGSRTRPCRGHGALRAPG